MREIQAPIAAPRPGATASCPDHGWHGIHRGPLAARERGAR